MLVLQCRTCHRKAYRSFIVNPTKPYLILDLSSSSRVMDFVAFATTGMNLFVQKGASILTKVQY